MPNYKYTVANPQGKRLSGTVEAQNEQIARAELNNLGFSILSLEETNEEIPQDDNLQKFVFEALDKSSKLVSGTIPSESKEAALKRLKEEYLLKVRAIWKEGDSEEEIEKAKAAGLQSNQETEEEINQNQNSEQFQKEQKVRAKIDSILEQVNELLVKFDSDFDAQQKSEINKKIDKILRIKNSKNTDYILANAEELLEFIQSQEKAIKEKGMENDALSLHLSTKNLIQELKQSEDKKNLSEDIISKIDNWQRKNKSKENTYIQAINKILTKIKNLFITPEEIKTIEKQITNYNKQIIEFSILYFKEPTKEYKEKVKQALKQAWESRKKTVHSLNHAKRFRKNSFPKNEEKSANKEIITTFINELNSFTGWLLTFYIIYYFTAIYLTTKDFGIENIPQAFYIYDTTVFKYLISILFLLHACTAIKINFFQKNLLASVILSSIFIIGSIIVLLNF
ncbi:hypothetical protein COU74_04165 [Candidatus Peregrinibacteria bacterium CG10_big_fil_rev_8_21_14_0_10_36_19]|nr:MAG: hypothetical protein COU74_04165 [Candidatus Peregrinibacteria bacterium CG10_big_fil_rev_8_21_14_0_10_36_19]